MRATDGAAGVPGGDSVVADGGVALRRTVGGVMLRKGRKERRDLMLRGGLRMLRCILRLRRERLACGTYLVGGCQLLQVEADPSRQA